MCSQLHSHHCVIMLVHTRYINIVVDYGFRHIFFLKTLSISAIFHQFAIYLIANLAWTYTLQPNQHCVEWRHSLFGVYYTCDLQKRFWLVHFYRPTNLSNAWCLKRGNKRRKIKLLIQLYLQLKKREQPRRR